MCTHVFLAAETPLTVIPWDREKPSFHVQLVPESVQEQVGRQFQNRYIFAAGTDQGCGCGFEYGYDGRALPRGTSERESSRIMVSELSQYLKREIQRVGPIEIYSCWDGDEARPADHRMKVTPSDIGGDRFRFLDRQYLLVVEQ
jgi:hypothetical protein